jgi:putative FmdB family regulatory protein
LSETPETKALTAGGAGGNIHLRGHNSVPLYEYQCPTCGRFEVIRKFSDPPLEECPTCGKAVTKLASAPAIQFKGAGWYVTDYAKKSSGGDSSKSGESQTSSKESKESKDSSSSASKEATSASSSKDTSAPSTTSSATSSASGSSPSK